MTTDTTLTPADLIYAASSRCPCGAGLAYRRDAKPYGEFAHWDCSAILIGTASLDVTHTGELPFAFYEIKSEGQPSANGASTRPVEDDQAKLDRAIAEAKADGQRFQWLINHCDEERAKLEVRRCEYVTKLCEANERYAAACARNAR